MTEYKFEIDDLVRKKSGYDWPGIVVGIVKTSTSITIAVENRLCPGTVHIFPEFALMPETRTDQEIFEEIKKRILP